MPYVCSDKLNSDFEKALVVLNPESLLGTKALLPVAGMHRIGFWHWELPVFPPRWSAAFDFVDELWAPSRFVAEPLRCATSKPVSIIPHAVKGSAVEKEAARRTLGLPGDAFVFLTIFDGRSYVTRKNPEAAVRAFRDAFPQDGAEKVLLIVKYHCVPGSTNPAEGLCPVIAGDRRVQLINQVFSNDEMAALTSAADVFVSLHRSEGFGLNIAEAMATGRLAVATDFSGNTDFMNEANSLLVPYTMRAVQPGEYPLGTGQWWAEPDHEAAVEALRTAFHDPEQRSRLAQKAKEDMAAKHSPKAVGRRIAAALDWPATGG